MPGELDRGALALIAALLLAGCPPPCPATGAQPPVTARSAEAGDTEIAAEAEKLADQTCACPTTFCAESTSSQLAALLRDRAGRMSGAPATRVLVAATRVLGCRDRLSYPSEPVDMDGTPASTPAGGGASGSAEGPDGSGSGSG